MLNKKSINKFVHKIRVRTWVALLVFVVLIPIIILGLYHPSESKAEWFNDAWTYRQPWSFTHNAALTDRRVTFTISNTNTLVTAGKLQSDCDDIRFTDSAGKLLRLQLTGTCNSASTTFDIIIPSVISGLNSGYLYYGNPGSSTASEDISAFTSLSPSGGAPAFTTEEKGTGPIAYWAMNEATDNTCAGGTNDACDSTSKGNDLAFAGSGGNPTWKSEDNCIAGKCLYFDGTDDKATLTQNATVNDLGTSGDSFSVSTWIKIGSATASSLSFVTKRTGGGWYFGSQGTTTLMVFCSAWSTTTHTFTKTFRDDKWHQLVMVKSGSNILLYYDGQPVTAASGGTGATGSCNTSNDILVGQDAQVADKLKGFIDETKIYNYARTSAQVKTEFAGKGTSQGVSARFGQEANSFLNDGLMGYWPMDESTANGCPTASADNCDKSGNTNDATWNGNAAGGLGKFGNAVALDGTGDFMTTSYNHNFATGVTVSGWINTSVAPAGLQEIIANGGADSGSTGISFRVNASGGLLFEGSKATGGVWNWARNSVATVNSGTWRFVAATWDGTTGANQVRVFIDGNLDSTATALSAIGTSSLTTAIGRISGVSDFQGSLDEIRIYGRALSDSEIKSLSNWAPGPVGYWKMDEGSWTNDCSTNTVFDSSGNGYSGLSCDGASSGQSGKFGNAGFFNDTVSVNDRVTISTPSGSKIRFDQTYNSFTLEAWAKPSVNGTNGGQLISTRGSNSESYFTRIDGSNVPHFFISDGTNQPDATGGTAPNNTWTHVTGVRDTATDTIYLYVNGILVNSVNDTTTSTIFNNTLTGIGNGTGGGNDFFDFTGTIDDARIYNYARTQQQIVEDLNGGHPAGGSPVGSQVIYYKMDEQNGATVNNTIYAQSALTGTITGALWKTKEVCKSNGCLDFDGVDDLISTTNASAIDLNEGLASGFTVGGWIFPDNAGEGSGGRIWSKNTNTWLRVDTLSGGKLDIEGSLDLATADATLNVTARVTQSAWNYVAMSWTDDGDDEITIWVNGVAVGTSTNGNGAPAADTGALTIGQETGGTTQTFDGKIDEIKVYSSELTADQIKIERNFGSNNNFGVGTDEASLISGGAGNGPTVYLPLDDGSGTSTVVNTAPGNGNFTMNNIETSDWNHGKLGNSITFDGVDEFLSSTVNVFSADATGSYSLWLKSTDPTGTYGIFYSNNTSGSETAGNIESSTYYAGVYDGSSFKYANGGTVDTNWHHLVYTWDGTIGKTFLYIDGKQVGTYSGATWTQTGTSNVRFANQNHSCCSVHAGSTFWKGDMDEIKAYDYVLSPAQIAYDFNRGKAVAWWKFDECTGNTLNDAIGTNNGTWNGSGGGSQTSAGSCVTASTAWGNGATGKLNSSLNFDGTDDYVSVSDNTTLDIHSGSMTWNFWFKNSQSSRNILYRKSDGSNANGVYVDINASVPGQIQCLVNLSPGVSATSSSSIWNDGAWHNLTCMLDRVNGLLKIFVDGSQQASVDASALGSTDLDATAGVQIGQGSGSFTTGQIDDVKIFNYPLSTSQIKKLYNDNSGARFGPSSGTP